MSVAAWCDSRSLNVFPGRLSLCATAIPVVVTSNTEGILMKQPFSAATVSIAALALSIVAAPAFAGKQIKPE